MNNYFYTEKEKSLVRKLYPITSTKTLAKRLGVKPKSLNAVALKWGLVKENKWLSDEIQFLKNNHLKLSAEQIAKSLKRSFSSVYSKAEKLGLYFNRWTKEEMDYLRKVYVKGGTKAFRSKYPEKSSSTISAKASTLGLKRNKSFSRTTWSKQDLLFLKDNYTKMSNHLIAKYLGKTRIAIEHKARKLNITSPIKYGHLEGIVENYLKEQQLTYSKQVRVDRFRIDFVVNDIIAIEVNGAYWHCDKRVFPKPINEKQRRVLITDRCKYKTLRSKGYRLIILWEKDINEDFSKVANGIVAVLSGDIQEYNSAKSVKA